MDNNERMRELLRMNFIPPDLVPNIERDLRVLLRAKDDVERDAIADVFDDWIMDDDDHVE